MDNDLLAFLVTRDRPYCFRCLRQAFPHTPVREQIEEARQAGAPLLTGEGRCAICEQSTTVVAYITGDPDLTRFGHG